MQSLNQVSIVEGGREFLLQQKTWFSRAVTIAIFMSHKVCFSPNPTKEQELKNETHLRIWAKSINLFGKRFGLALSFHLLYLHQTRLLTYSLNPGDLFYSSYILSSWAWLTSLLQLEGECWILDWAFFLVFEAH